MYKLSDDIVAQLRQHESPVARDIPDGRIILFEGRSGRILIDLGFFNFVVEKRSGLNFAVRIIDVANSKIVVKHMPNLKSPNTSNVVSVGMEGDLAYAQHWDGFCSYFDPNDFSIRAQIFTK